jgi:hypothetical protein
MNASGQTRRRFAQGAAACCALSFAPLRVKAGVDYAKRVLAKRPVAYWRLGEQRGPVAADAASHSAAEIADNYRAAIQ